MTTITYLFIILPDSRPYQTIAYGQSSLLEQRGFLEMWFAGNATDSKCREAKLKKLHLVNHLGNKHLFSL